MLPADSEESPRISAVVVSFNTRDDVLRCLASLERNVSRPFEALVVDNASHDGSVAAIRATHTLAQVVSNERNVGFAAACNQGLRSARAPYVLFINSDAEVQPAAVDALAAVLDARPDAAVVGPRTVNEDGTVQVSFGPDLTLAGEFAQRRLVRGVRARDPDALRRADDASRVECEPAWVSGSCMLARRTALEQVGLFDEGFFLYEEDVDLCVRLRRAGWHIVFTPSAEVMHRLGRSMETTGARSRFEYHRSHLRFYRKHRGVLRTSLLRSWLAGRNLFRWAASLGPGQPRLDARREATGLVRLAIFGR